MHWVVKESLKKLTKDLNRPLPFEKKWAMSISWLIKGSFMVKFFFWKET